MKKLIIIALLLPVFCFGQKKDSVIDIMRMTSGSGTPATSIGSSILWTTPTYHSTGFVIIPKQDTIPVIMLVCDTASGVHSLQLWFSEQGKASNEGRLVWWQFGYEVLRYRQENNGEQTWDIQELVTYLDKDKKPLPKSLVVWMTKEIK